MQENPKLNVGLALGMQTSVSNGYRILVIRGLSDLAGGQSGHNAIQTFGSLAARNTAKVVVQFLKELKPWHL